MSAPITLVVGGVAVPLPSVTRLDVHPETRDEFIGTLRSLLAVPGASEPENSSVVLCTTVKFGDENYLTVTVYASQDMKRFPAAVPPIPGLAELEDAISEAVAS